MSQRLKAGRAHWSSQRPRRPESSPGADSRAERRESHGGLASSPFLLLLGCSSVTGSTPARIAISIALVRPTRRAGRGKPTSTSMGELSIALVRPTRPGGRGKPTSTSMGELPITRGRWSWLLSNVSLDRDLRPCPAKPSEKTRSYEQVLERHTGAISDSGPRPGPAQRSGNWGSVAFRCSLQPERTKEGAS
jgi:hypothetical protein